jgi:hypothetical protein
MAEIILNLIVTKIDDKNVTCKVIYDNVEEYEEYRIFEKILFDNDVDINDEYIGKITSGVGFTEINVFPKKEKTSRILIEKVNHKEQELDCYVPQIKFNDKWYNVLEKGSYILKDSFDPVILCKGCYGEGCQECKKRGFRKGVSVDLKYIVQSFINKEIKNIKEANDLISKYNLK